MTKEKLLQKFFFFFFFAKSRELYRKLIKELSWVDSTCYNNAFLAEIPQYQYNFDLTVSFYK